MKQPVQTKLSLDHHSRIVHGLCATRGSFLVDLIPDFPAPSIELRIVAA